MARDLAGPAADRLQAVRLDAVATRHARWGAITEHQTAAAAGELREIADGRCDLLAEVAGLALGTTEHKGPQYQARGRPWPGCAASQAQASR